MTAKVTEVSFITCQPAILQAPLVGSELAVSLALVHSDPTCPLGPPQFRLWHTVKFSSFYGQVALRSTHKARAVTYGLLGVELQQPEWTELGICGP